jgi:hypothetical protein
MAPPPASITSPVTAGEGRDDGLQRAPAAYS